MKARLIIADDHEVVRQGLRDIVEATADLAVVAEAADGIEAERLARSCAADLLLLDIALPQRRGFSVLESLRRDAHPLPVLFFSMYPAAQYAEPARRGGAQGFLGKDANAQTLLKAIREVLGGGSVFPEGEHVAARGGRADDPFRKLSSRETEVMLGLVAGDSLDEIAERLAVAPKSVSTYRSRLLVKLGLSNNVELAALAIREGYL